MPIARSLDLDTFDPKINKTLSILRKQREVDTLQVSHLDNNEDQVLRDYAMPSIDGATTSIHRLVIQTAHFEIKIAEIQMIKNTIQFNGHSHMRIKTGTSQIF